MDIWSIGCILYELISGKPLFPGKNKNDQILKIHSILGTPDPESLNNFNRNSALNFGIPLQNKTDLTKMMPNIHPEILDLIEKLLAYNPSERISAEDSLQHDVFKTFMQLEKQYKLSSKTIPFSEYAITFQNQKAVIDQSKTTRLHQENHKAHQYQRKGLIANTYRTVQQRKGQHNFMISGPPLSKPELKKTTGSQLIKKPIPPGKIHQFHGKIIADI